MQNATWKHIPIYGILELTPLCNFNCDMCFVRLSTDEQKKAGELLPVEKWMSLADEMAAKGTLFVLLTGGEPLLYPGFRTLYEHLRKLGMIITVNTNGSLIDEQWADFFARNKPRRINITLYGKDADTYASLCHNPEGYDKTIRGIRLLKDRGIDVKVNGSITPANIQDAVRITEIAEELAVPWKLDTYMYPGSRERSRDFNSQARLTPEQAAGCRVRLMQRQHPDFRQFAEDFFRKATEDSPEHDGAVPCRAGRSSFAVNWTGKLRPCVMVTTPEFDVTETRFSDGWDSLVAKTAEIKLSSRCNGCKRRNVCQTCAACALLETGHYDGTPDYMCAYTEHTVRLMEEILHGKEI